MPVETRNYTPFPTLGFESRGHGGEVYHVFVLKGTFRLANSPRLKPIPEQSPLVMADEYYGDPTSSSVRLECDINPFKPATDIHLIGCARSPRSQPSQQWTVRLKVGQIEKALRVTGPRHWKHGTLGRWMLTAPEPCIEVPLRYELAYGGVFGEGKEAQVCEQNPVGRGHTGGKRLSGLNDIPAPQIEAADDPIDGVGKPHQPQGFGPIARSWQPRLRKAGTFDDHWLGTRWPDIPDDFNFAHYNSAHPDLIAPDFLKGDESVELEGVHPNGIIRTALPRYTVFCLVRLINGAIAPAPMNLDTAVFDVDNWLAFLVWRCRLPVRLDVRVMEARLILPKEDRHG
ncbi:MAG: DUF2169 domain-containing protein [Verrucomicrobiales bacterium]|nr:DUF2169 domain-containing protein [Verrucomicrobiales bacterium]